MPKGETSLICMYFNHCYSSFEFAWFAITFYIWTTLTTLAPSRTFYRSENHPERIITGTDFRPMTEPGPAPLALISSPLKIVASTPIVQQFILSPPTCFSSSLLVQFFLTTFRDFISHQLKMPVRGFFILGASFFQPVLCQSSLWTVRELRGAEPYFNHSFNLLKSASIWAFCKGTVSQDFHVF